MLKINKKINIEILSDYKKKIENEGSGKPMISKFSYKFTSPPQPVLYAKVDHQSVVLSWTGDAESALDSLTGYSEFEGYRNYKSTDGWTTW